MSIVESQPSAAACAAVYQAARILRLWNKAREVLQLWDALAASRTVTPGCRPSLTLPDRDKRRAGVVSLVVSGSGDTLVASTDDEISAGVALTGDAAPALSYENDVDMFHPVRLFCHADIEARVRRSLSSH